MLLRVPNSIVRTRLPPERHWGFMDENFSVENKLTPRMLYLPGYLKDHGSY